MADLHAGLDAGREVTGARDVAALFRDRYPEMVRLADLLGADDPEDIAQEAFARRGFGVKVWSVTYPPDGAVRVTFRDASGHQLASLTRPAVPAALTQGPAQAPGGGGVGAGRAPDGGQERIYPAHGVDSS